MNLEQIASLITGESVWINMFLIIILIVNVIGTGYLIHKINTIQVALINSSYVHNWRPSTDRYEYTKKTTYK